MDGSTMVNRMAERYASCRSYLDKGTATTTMGVGSEQRLTFETHFERTGKFRFEWWSHHPFFKESGPTYRDVIWSDGTRSYSLLHVSPDVCEQTLELTIASATGISQRTALIVPTLLLPELSHMALFQRADWTYEGTETVSGEQRHRLHGTWTKNDDVEIWLDERTSLLRKWRCKTTIVMAEINQMMERAMPLMPKGVDVSFLESMMATMPAMNPVTDCVYEAAEVDCEIDANRFRLES